MEILQEDEHYQSGGYSIDRGLGESSSRYRARAETAELAEGYRLLVGLMYAVVEMDPGK